MRTPLHLQPDYTTYRGFYQIKLPIDMETMIPADDPVRLLSAFVEGMDLSELYATYDRIRKNQATPRQMLKIMSYASMNRLFSSREIETACKRDINFMYLLEGMPAPDHSTIARFISLHLSSCPKKILKNVTSILHNIGEIMLNGQLKPAYNLQHGVDAQYITWLAQSVLLAIAYNINKLHFKIQGGRTGQFLTELKGS